MRPLDGVPLAALESQVLMACGFPPDSCWMIRQMSSDLGWELREIETGHWPMISSPDQVAKVLVDLA